MKDAIVGALLALLLREAIAMYMEFRSRRPDPPLRHELRGNYFSARAPFAIVRVGGPVEERSDEHVDRMAHRLGRLRDRRWTDSEQP